MKAVVRWVAVLAAAMAFIMGCFCLYRANHAYEEADRWFYRAAYNAQCPVSGSSGCQKLLQQKPNWPFGVEVHDEDVLLAQANALHSTGSGILTISGLFMATSGVLLASTNLSFSAPWRSSPAGGIRNRE